MPGSTPKNARQAPPQVIVVSAPEPAKKRKETPWVSVLVSFVAVIASLIVGFVSYRGTVQASEDRTAQGLADQLRLQRQAAYVQFLSHYEPLPDVVTEVRNFSVGGRDDIPETAEAFNKLISGIKLLQIDAITISLSGSTRSAEVAGDIVNDLNSLRKLAARALGCVSIENHPGKDNYANFYASVPGAPLFSPCDFPYVYAYYAGPVFDQVDMLTKTASQFKASAQYDIQH